MITITVLGEKSDALRVSIVDCLKRQLEEDFNESDEIGKFQVVEKFSRKARKSKVIE